MRKGLSWCLGVGFLLAGQAVSGATAALAHEERTAGRIGFVIGWGEEPPYTGLKNSVEVRVFEADGTPITDLGNALKVEVIKGSEKVTMSLEPTFGPAASGAPGTYRAWLTPTRPGAYTFRLTGNLRGQAVDETFTSSPTTFDEVQEASSIQFPAKDPSPGQLATRLDREIPRLSTRTDAIEAALEEAGERADVARTLAIVGAAAGVLGLLVGGFALLTARRATSPRVRSDVGPATSSSEHARSLRG